MITSQSATVCGIGTIPSATGFDGPTSIEYEGQVPDLYAIETVLANATRIWDEIWTA